MSLMRGAIAVVAGYLIMAATSMAIAGRLFEEAAPAPDNGTLILSFLGLAIGAAIGGAICTLIAGSANSPAIYIAIGVVAVMGGRTLIMGTGAAPDWYTIGSVIALAIGFLVGASAAAYRLDPR